MTANGFCCSSSELSPPLSESVSPVAKNLDIFAALLLLEALSKRHVVTHVSHAEGAGSGGGARALDIGDQRGSHPPSPVEEKMVYRILCCLLLFFCRIQAQESKVQMLLCCLSVAVLTS